MRVLTTLKAAGDSHPGLLREINEDRFHFDPARGIFMVVDGVGGHAAGERAADAALTMLRQRLERQTGPVPDRVREAIAIANNEIHRLASLRPEWQGMACVLTVAVVENGTAVIGHVGDSRLYKLRNGHVDKITRDHSPVGEREDAHEISEIEAMRHPRRNEVYRDVGSEPHDPADPGFIELHEIPFEPDAALLLCSDGLTDLVPSGVVGDIVHEFAGRPHEVVRALIDAANHAGGTDNVTVVYVEGEKFGPPATALAASLRSLQPVRTPATPPREAVEAPLPESPRRLRRWRLVSLIVLSAIVIAVAVWRPQWPWRWPGSSWRWPGSAVPRPSVPEGAIVVLPTESIAAALARARPGSEVIVEPGEYRERLVLRDDIRLVSREPRRAIIRLPGGASEGDAAVAAVTPTAGALVGFRILGDAATPLGIGVQLRETALALIDVEITGAVNAAVEFGQGAASALIGSDVHDNPGAALVIRAGATPRISHSVFARNTTSERAPGAFVIERGAAPRFSGNVFDGLRPEAFTSLDDAARALLARDNWFTGAAGRRSGPQRQGRR